MAIALPSTSNDYATANGTTGTAIAVNKPTNTADGDYLIAVIYNQLAGATFTKPTGWTEIYHAVASSTRGFGVYYKYIPSAAAESATSYTWTASASARWIGQIFRMTGASASTLVDAAPTSDAYNSTSSSTVTDPAVTAVGSAAFALAFNFTNNSTAVYQTFSLSGWTPFLNSTVTNGASTSVVDVQSKQLSASGSTGTAAFTMSPAAATAGGFLVTFTPAVVNTATASLTLTASGGGAAAGAGGASLTLSGSAQAPGNNATAALTLTASGGAAAPATATASLTLSASGYSSTPITQWINAGTMWVAHRGGYASTLGEETLEAYTAAAAQYSKAALEISVWKCSTGEYVCSHDQNTSRVFGTSLDIPTTSWSTLSTLTTTTGGYQIRRLSDIVQAGALSGRLFVIDNKANTADSTLISYLNSNAAGRWMGKGYFSSKTWLQAVQADGKPVWAYFYPTDLGSLSTAAGNYPTTTPVIFGLGDYSSSGAGLPVQSDANTFFSFLTSYPAIKTWAHIPNTPTQRATADSQAATAGGAFNGYIVQGFAATAPNDAGTASASLTLTASGTAAARGTGTASLTLSAAGSAGTSATGTAAITLTAAGTGSAAAVGAAALALAASGTGQGPGNYGTANLSLTAAGVAAVLVTAAAALTLTASGTGAGGGAPTGNAALNLTATGAGGSLAAAVAQVLLTATGHADGGARDLTITSITVGTDRWTTTVTTDRWS